MAVAYGLAGPEEGAAYLEDRVLAARLVDAASAVRAHVGPSLDTSFCASMRDPITIVAR